eukprot:gene5770-11661_t
MEGKLIRVCVTGLETTVVYTGVPEDVLEREVDAVPTNEQGTIGLDGTGEKDELQAVTNPARTVWVQLMPHQKRNRDTTNGSPHTGRDMEREAQVTDPTQRTIKDFLPTVVKWH